MFNNTISFTTSIYDYILLLPLLAYSLKNFFKENFSNKYNYDLYFYFGLRIIKEFGVNTDLNIIINYVNIVILAFYFSIIMYFIKNLLREKFNK